MPNDEMVICEVCSKPIKLKEIYRYQARQLCAYCCMEARMPRSRKPHWQYLNSIKADYLRYPKKGV